MTDTDVIEIHFLHDMEVELIDHMGKDKSVVQAARVSTGGKNEVVEDEEITKLINYLMSHRHGTPFEHNAIQLYVKAPIFVFREFHRHRIGFSYNEYSARYSEMLPEFYTPSVSRKIVNIGTSARPVMGPGDEDVIAELSDTLVRNSYIAWSNYQKLLSQGIAKEVARMVLPVNIMSQMYVTLNARSMMSFLSLRTHDEEAHFISYPQREIEMVAQKMEIIFKKLFPITHATFVANGRVAP